MKVMEFKHVCNTYVPPMSVVYIVVDSEGALPVGCAAGSQGCVLGGPNGHRGLYWFDGETWQRQ